MPYKHAHYYVGAVLLVILAGFWTSYFSVIRTSPFAFHFHAFASTSWLLLLIAQSVAIHRRHHAFHRTMGKASFALFPALIVGFVLIINVSAARYASGDDPFMNALGPAFVVGLGLAMAAYLTLYYNALRHRRNVKLHAGYLLATPVILFESPFGRVIGEYLPWMNVIGSEGPRAVLDGIAISNALMIAFVLALYFRDRRHGAPWLVAAGFMAFQTWAMWTAHAWPVVREAFLAYAGLPAPLTVLAGALAAIAVTWAGWQNGKPASRTPAGALLA